MAYVYRVDHLVGEYSQDQGSRNKFNQQGCRKIQICNNLQRSILRSIPVAY